MDYTTQSKIERKSKQVHFLQEYIRDCNNRGFGFSKLNSLYKQLEETKEHLCNLRKYAERYGNAPTWKN